MSKHRKFKYFTFEVYPDNKPQKSFFDWFIDTEKNTLVNGGMYIEHKPEKEGAKKHIHIMAYRDIALNGVRTEQEDGFYYQINTLCNWSGSYEYFIDDTDKVYYKEYDLEGLPDSVEWEVRQTINHCEGVSDPVAMAAYFLHKRYCDKDKTQYQFEDLRFFGEDTRFRQLFDNEDSINTDLTFEIYQIALNNDIKRGEGQKLVKISVDLGRVDLLNYIRKNHAFIEFYLLNPRKGLK